MSADSKNVSDTCVDKLASFDDRLHATANDVDMLADIQKGLGRLLAGSGNSEGEIRRILQERYAAGELRKETFQLVKSLLDRYVTENIPTSPTPAESSATPPQATTAAPPIPGDPSRIPAGSAAR